MLRTILLLVVMITLMTGCQSAYYSAMEKVGIHKRDILIDRVEEATESQESQQKLRQTENRYQSVIRAMHSAERKMAPVLSALQDNMLYLKHNLNAKAIGALKGEYKHIKQDIDALVTDMNASIADSQAFIESLK